MRRTFLLLTISTLLVTTQGVFANNSLPALPTLSPSKTIGFTRNGQYVQIECPWYNQNYDCNDNHPVSLYIAYKNKPNNFETCYLDEDEQKKCPNRIIIKDTRNKEWAEYKSFLSCPQETPLMDKNGTCYPCNVENNQIELLENYHNPCPNRKTFKPVDKETLQQDYYDGIKKLAPTCSPEKPLLIQEGYYARCIECDGEFENYPRVIGKQDCDVCPNRTYFSGWCVNGTREKPLVSSQWVQDGRSYRTKQQNVSCDTDEDISMEYFDSDWCSAVCPNRFRMNVTKIPNVYAYCVKKTILNYIRNFWERYYLIIILLGIVSLFLLPKILTKIFSKKD